MGHFSQTCLLSHLPVTGGTPIRVCLLASSPYAHAYLHGEAWTFRSIPFRAVYNDYGSIENVHPEDQILVDLALAQFNRDAVEVPQGDNPYHDPPVTRGMPAEGWWDALWEGRLQVRGYYRGFRVKVPKGTPSWRKVKKLTDRAVEKGKLIPGTIVNRIAYGLVRVTYEGDYQKRYEWYKAIRPVLERRYKVTERYENGPKYHEELVAAADKLGEDPVVRASLDVWFEVAPKDGPYPPVSPAREMRDKALVSAIEGSKGRIHGRREVCDIAWAFIREDAWQAILPLGGPNYTGWRNSPTVEGEKAKLAAAIESAVKSAETWKRIMALPTSAERLTARLEEDADYASFLGVRSNLEDKYPSLKSNLTTRESMGAQVEDMLDLLGKGAITREQGDRVVQAVAEYTVISSMMSTVCIAPHPTHGGPQDGAWEAHVAFHNALTPVVLKADPYPPEEGEESDGDDEGALNSIEPENGAPEGGNGELNSIEPLDPPEPDVTDEETTYADVDIEKD